MVTTTPTVFFIATNEDFDVTVIKDGCADAKEVLHDILKPRVDHVVPWAYHGPSKKQSWYWMDQTSSDLGTGLTNSELHRRRAL
jgi:hypothetical protein